MKVGDLVKLDPRTRWLTLEECSASGIIIAMLDGGSHRKNKSYQVVWSDIMLPRQKKVNWHVEPDLMKVELG